MMSNMEREKLYQIAGDVIINRYENYETIPEKYKELYITYIPQTVGIKRKASSDAEQD
jgi:hypothetical protein